MTDRKESCAKSLAGVADRLSLAFLMARAIEMAIAGAPIDDGAKEALDLLAVQHGNALRDLRDDVDKLLAAAGDNP